MSTHTLSVVGLGYVGLTTALLAARAGYKVTGVDTNAERLAMVAAGRTPFSEHEPALEALCAELVRDGKLTVSKKVVAADYVFVAVPTPVQEDGQPDTTALVSALRAVAAAAANLQLLSVESTLAPGTMQALVAPLFERAASTVIHAPERVMPGKLVHNATTLARVLGVESDAAWQLASEIYTRIYGAPLRRCNWVNAELTKTAENAWRDVNIAFANTLALACEAAGGDFDIVRERVNESPGRQVLKAGVGVGGACLPKDTHLLAAVLPSDGYLRAARSTNERMPAHAAALIEQAAGGSLRGKRVLILGASYLENVGDIAHSPALALATLLRGAGAAVEQHDPHLAAFDGDVYQQATGCDLIALATDHDAYTMLDWRQLRQRAAANAAFVDLRSSILLDAAMREGFRVRRLGRGASFSPAEQPISQ